MKYLLNTIAALSTLAIIAGFGILILNAPQYHADWIRSHVGSQVVMLTNEERTAGGTGFALKTIHGRVLTLTNAHVCGLQNAKGEVFATSPDIRPLPLKVIEIDKEADLCLLSGIARMKGLSLASSVEVGEELGIVGHPHLMPLALTRGQLLGYAMVVVGLKEGPCDKDEGMYKTVDGFLGQVCTEQFQAGLTTIPSLPGNSGSPVVNFYGNVTGVLFAGSAEANNWGVIVTLDEVKAFTKDY